MEIPENYGERLILRPNYTIRRYNFIKKKKLKSNEVLRKTRRKCKGNGKYFSSFLTVANSGRLFSGLIFLNSTQRFTKYDFSTIIDDNNTSECKNEYRYIICRKLKH